MRHDCNAAFSSLAHWNNVHEHVSDCSRLLSPEVYIYEFCSEYNTDKNRRKFFIVGLLAIARQRDKSLYV